MSTGPTEQPPGEPRRISAASAFTVRDPDKTGARLNWLAEVEAGLTEAENGLFAAIGNLIGVIAK